MLKKTPGVRNLAIIAQKQPTAGEEAFQLGYRPTYPSGRMAYDAAQLGRDQRRLEPASTVIMVPVRPCALALEAKNT